MVDGADRSPPDDLERELRDVLEGTGREYRLAVTECARLVKIRDDLGDTPDGPLMMRWAVMRQRVTLEYYSRALRNFSDFVLYGQVLG